MAKPRDPASLLTAGIVLVGIAAPIAFLSGCNSPPTATPVVSSQVEPPSGEPSAPEPTTDVSLGPRVEVVAGGAIVNSLDTTAALAEGESAEVGVDTQVSVDDAGRAEVTYPGASDTDEPAPDFLLIDLPRRVDLEIVAAEPSSRLAEIATAGVGRVTVAGADDAQVLLTTGVFEVNVDHGPADVIVITCVDPESMDEFPAATGACPGEAAGGWVAVTFGEATTTDSSPTDASEPESLVTPLAKGQAAAFSSTGSIIAVLDLGVAAIEDWYDAYLDGSDEPLAELPTPTATLDAEEVTATTAPLATPEFAAERTEIEPGECTLLAWNVSGVREVDLDGEPRPNPDQLEVCPEQTTTYYLTWTTPDGAENELELVVWVSGDDGSGDGGDSGGSSSGGSSGSGGDGGDGGDGDRPPYATRTPCATREACPIPSLDPDATSVPVPTVAPPTQAPPTDLPPTDLPATEPPPTNPPPTQPPPTDPPSSPEPATEPPAPEPTAPETTPDP